MSTSEQRQKVTHNVITKMAAHTAGSYSETLQGVQELPQHCVSIAISGTPTGIVSVRARPVGASGFTKVYIESVNLATDARLSWIVNGFYDAWVLVVGTGLAGGSCQLIVSSCTEGL